MHHDDRNGAGRSSRRKRRGHRLSDDDIDLACHEFACELVQASFAALGEAFLNQDCLAIDVAELGEPLSKCDDICCTKEIARRPEEQHPDARDFRRTLPSGGQGAGDERCRTQPAHKRAPCGHLRMPTCRSPRAIRFPRLTLGSTNYRGNGGYQQTCPLWIESTG